MKFIKLFEDYEEDEKQLIEYLISLIFENKRMKADMRKVKHFIVDKGVDINAYNKNYGTLLCLSVFIGDTNLTKYLIKHGAILNLANTIGSTPVYIASSFGYFDILVCLVEHGADYNKENNSKVTPVMAAAQKRNFDCAIYLLKKGAEISNFFSVFTGNVYEKNYEFQKVFIEMHPDEFVDNMPIDDIDDRIKKQYEDIFIAKKYNL